MTKPWRLAGSLEVLRHEVNARWPDRSKVSDGTIGDAAHASTGSSSDHNPWIIDGEGQPVVRAFDITSASIDADWLAEHLRQLGAAGDPRLADHGYVIWAGRIASATQSWWWRAYTGADPHTSHIHVSVARGQDGYDSPATWLVNQQDEDPPVPHPVEDDDFMAHLTDAQQDALVMQVAQTQDRMDGVEKALKTLLGPDEDGTDERVALFDKKDGLYAKVDAIEVLLAKVAAKVGA